MFGLSKKYHPLDSRHTANRAKTRDVEKARETFRTANKGRALRHFFLPPTENTARERLGELLAKHPLSSSEQHELQLLEARLYEVDVKAAEQDARQRTPFIFKVFFAPLVELNAHRAGRKAVRGRKYRGYQFHHLVLALGALGLLVWEAGGVSQIESTISDALRGLF